MPCRDITAFLKLRLYAVALNDGWWSTYGDCELRYSPFFSILTDEAEIWEKMNDKCAAYFPLEKEKGKVTMLFCYESVTEDSNLGLYIGSNIFMIIRMCPYAANVGAGPVPARAPKEQNRRHVIVFSALVGHRAGTGPAPTLAETPRRIYADNHYIVFKTDALAEYAGKTFIEDWAHFLYMPPNEL